MIGTTISHFRILSKLGEGGMGEVYLAEDTELDRQVALKVLPPAMAEDPERLERFRREAKAVAALNHPNIVAIYSIEEAGGQRFLIMELVEGESLDRMLPPQGMPLAKVFDIAIPMADALATAHDKGIVHRDLKPANVMVTSEGRVKVLDFGLAKLAAEATETLPPGEVSQAETRTATLTSEGTVMGTAPYMSPEQLQGQPVDHRTDIFSLGVMLYELVTGQRPFQGESGIDLASRILRESPSAVTEVRADLPRHLGRIIQHCLEKHPERRFQSAKDVRNELEGLREEVKSGSVTAVSSPPAPQPATALPSARLVRWLGIAAALLAVAGAAWWMGWGTTERESPAAGTGETATAEVPSADAAGPSVAVLPFADLSPEGDQEYFTDGLTDELIATLNRVADLRVAGRTSVFQFKGKNEDLEVIGEKLNVSAILEGSVRKAGDQVRISTQLVNVADGFPLWNELYNRTLDDVFQLQDEIAREVASALEATLLGTSPAPTVKSVDAQAYELLLQARYHIARGSREDRRQARELLSEAIEIQPDFAPAWSDLGRVHANTGYFAKSRAEAQTEYSLAEEAMLRAIELDPGLATAHSRLSWVQTTTWRFEEARASRDRALEIAPNDRVVLGNSASLALTLGQLDEGVELSRRVVEIDPLDALSYSNYAWALRVSGRLEEAEAAVKTLMELAPGFPGNHMRLGEIYLLQGQARRALEAYQLEADELPRTQGVAMASHALGDDTAAAQSLQILVDRFGEEAALELAQVHAFRGETDLAFQWLDRAYELHDSDLSQVKAAPLLRNLHDDPRWPRFLERMGLAG